MREAGVSKTVVWRWQDRFAQEGADGLLRDKTRPARIPPLGPEVAARVVALTQGEPPGKTTHWTAAAMSKAAAISVSSVQRIWWGHGLQPHRVRQFKLSTDPAFAAKLRDVVGLYVDPPAHAVVLSVDEKSQIQALARTQEPLPMKPGQPTTRTHDYKRRGTTTLFAALDVLEGKVIGRCMQRHRHQEFIRLPRCGRGGGSGGQDRPRDPGQLCRPQAPEGPCLARPPPALDLPLHPDLSLVAQCRRGLLRQARKTPAPTRRVRIADRGTGRHQTLHRREQRQSEALRLDRRPGPHHPGRKARAPSVRLVPLDRRRLSLRRALARRPSRGAGQLPVPENPVHGRHL